LLFSIKNMLILRTFIQLHWWNVKKGHLLGLKSTNIRPPGQKLGLISKYTRISSVFSHLSSFYIILDRKMTLSMIFEEFDKNTCSVPYRLNTTKSGCSLFHIKSTYFIMGFRHFLTYQIFWNLYSRKELYRYYRKTKRKRGVNFYIRKLQFG
jgi:hypothetical protein